MLRNSIVAMVVLLLLALALVAQTSQAEETEEQPAFVTNAGFEDGMAGEAPSGWKVRNSPGYQVVVSTDQPSSGGQCAALSLPSDASPGFANLIQRIDAGELRGKRVRLRGAVRADVRGTDNRVFMWFRVDRVDKDGTRRQGAFDNMWDRPIVNNQWQSYEIVGDVDDDATDITFGLFLRGKGQAWLDNVTLEVVGDDVVVTTKEGGARVGTPVDEIKPGLFEVESASRFTAYESPWGRLKGLFGATKPIPAQTVLMPLPLSYRDQVPLYFQLTVHPPQAVQTVDIYQDSGENFVLKLVVSDVTKHRNVDISFTSVVLVGPSTFASVPMSAAVPDEWPEESEPWLAATWCADAAHPRIKSLADQIRGETEDVRQIITKVEKQAAQIFGAATGRVDNLTAVEALDKQGSCTSCANLVAALLRACDVPARILAGYPSWTGPLQTHYIVEAYVPGFGWYPIESTRCESPWPNTHQVNVAIIPPEYEAESKASFRFGIAGGVPYHSLTEMPDNSGSVLKFGMIENAQNCDHECRMVRSLSGEAPQWQQAMGAARARWQAWLAAEHKLDARGGLQFGKKSAELGATSVGELTIELEGENP